MSRPQFKSRLSVSLDISTGSFSLSGGNGYFTFSIDEHRNRSVMFKTDDLQTITDLFNDALTKWKGAKEIEETVNVTQSNPLV